jgi:hypothetical protein
MNYLIVQLSFLKGVTIAQEAKFSHTSLSDGKSGELFLVVPDGVDGL